MPGKVYVFLKLEGSIEDYTKAVQVAWPTTYSVAYRRMVTISRPMSLAYTHGHALIGYAMAYMAWPVWYGLYGMPVLYGMCVMVCTAWPAWHCLYGMDCMA